MISIVEESGYSASARVAHESAGAAGQLAMERPVGRARAGIKHWRGEIKGAAAHTTIDARLADLVHRRLAATVVVVLRVSGVAAIAVWGSHVVTDGRAFAVVVATAATVVVVSVDIVAGTVISIANTAAVCTFPADQSLVVNVDIVRGASAVARMTHTALAYGLDHKSLDLEVIAVGSDPLPLVDKGIHRCARSQLICTHPSLCGVVAHDAHAQTRRAQSGQVLSTTEPCDDAGQNLGWQTRERRRARWGRHGRWFSEGDCWRLTAAARHCH
jgi:hypothetical protein